MSSQRGASGIIAIMIMLALAAAGCAPPQYRLTVSNDLATISADISVSLACAAGPRSETGLNCDTTDAVTRRGETNLLHYVDSTTAPNELSDGAQALANDAFGLVATPMTSATGLVRQSALVQDMQTIVNNMDATEGIGADAASFQVR